MGSFSIWHWLVVLLIVVLVFGTKKLKNLGSDLGAAVKGFKDGMAHGSSPSEGSAAGNGATAQVTADKSVADKTTIDVEAKTKS